MAIIKTRRNVTAGVAPGLGILNLGELALNTEDGYLYAANNAGTTVNRLGTTVDRVGGSQPTVPNLAGLRAYPKTGATRVLTAGYTLAGDLGASQYYYDGADTTSADNGGSIIVATDGGRWKMVPTGTYSVKQFGAKGDGATDDTVAFQAAVNAITAYGRGKLLIPASVYVIASTVNLNPQVDISIIGDGHQSTLILAKLTTTLFNYDNSANTVASKTLYVTGLKIQNYTAFAPTQGFYIQGAGTAATSDYRCMYFIFENVDVSGFVYGIRAFKATNFILSNIFPRGNANGLYLVQCGDFMVRGIKTGSNTQAAVYIDGGKPTSGAWGEGAFISDCVFNVDNNALYITNQDFVGVYDSQCGSTKNGSLIFKGCNDIFVQGNEISNTQAAADGLNFDTACTNASVIGNFIDNCVNYGLVLNGANHTVSGNVFAGNGTGSGQDMIVQSTGSTITGNRCASTPASAISIAEGASGNYNTFIGNVCDRSLTITGANTVSSLNVVKTGTNARYNTLRGASVSMTAAQSLATGTTTAIAFGSADFDTDTIHSNTTNNSRLTIPVGVNFVSVSARWQWAANSTGTRIGIILKNGTTIVARDDRTSTNETGGSTDTGPLRVVAGDYFELQGNQSSGAALNFGGTTNTRFSLTIL